MDGKERNGAKFTSCQTKHFLDVLKCPTEMSSMPWKASAATRGRAMIRFQIEIRFFSNDDIHKKEIRKDALCAAS